MSGCGRGVRWSDEVKKGRLCAEMVEVNRNEKRGKILQFEFPAPSAQGFSQQHECMYIAI